MSIAKQSFPFGSHTLTIETGELARQADGSVVVSMGDTVVLVTAVARKARAARQGFLSADRELPGKDLRGRPHPRWFFPS